MSAPVPSLAPSLAALAVLGLLVAGPLTPAAAQQPTHPLDGLSAAEHWALHEALRADDRVSDDAEFLYVGLDEPAKASVLAWRPGSPFGRRARVHFVQDDAGYEAVVDLVARRVIELGVVTDRQYMYAPSDREGTRDILEHPAMVAAFQARGITDLSQVRCGVSSDAYFDTPEERGRRLGRVRCSNNAGQVSGLGSPIANLVAVVDRQTGDVLRVMDGGPIDGVPPSVGEHHPEAVGATREALPPIVVSQPEGPGFVLHGSQVRWDGWRFHFRVDQRRGIVLSQVGHEDGDEVRPVLYQASLSELFVPYHDPSEPWNHQAYFDLGSYPFSFGGVTSTLEPGTDCPAYARFFDTWVTRADGSPEMRQRVVCLFERLPEVPAWRHTRDGGVVESRASRELVLRMIMGAGNYDYLFDWVFRQDGAIRVNLAATGIDQMKAVEAETAADDRTGADGRYGSFVAPHLVAVNHSHIINFRLDFDVDGPENTLLVDRLVTEVLPQDNPRRSVWRVQSTPAKRERDGMRTAAMTTPEIWRIVNPSRTGAMGYPSGYILEGHGIMSLLSPDDYLQKRAGFTEHTLWATPMSPRELFAAGDYPTNSAAGAGLPTWTASNRAIENTDIVLWYTIGFHHVARPEDWPILPLEMHGFNLLPAGFFDRNPAIDLPK